MEKATPFYSSSSRGLKGPAWKLPEALPRCWPCISITAPCWAGAAVRSHGGRGESLVKFPREGALPHSSYTHSSGMHPWQRHTGWFYLPVPSRSLFAIEVQCCSCVHQSLSTWITLWVASAPKDEQLPCLSPSCPCTLRPALIQFGSTAPPRRVQPPLAGAHTDIPAPLLPYLLCAKPLQPSQPSTAANSHVWRQFSAS